MTTNLQSIAVEVQATAGTGRQIAPFTSRPGGLELADAYRITALLRQAREAKGQKVVGRKIGFTNRTIWQQYGVYAPIWGYVYDIACRDVDSAPSLSLTGVAEPRIEPEIVFGIGRVPDASMDEAALLACIDWVAHGFEIVQSLYPKWQFQAADTVATNSLHGALLIGPRHAIGSRSADWLKELPNFTVELRRGGETIDRGHSSNVLGGPLSALRHLVQVLETDPVNPPVAAGEIITTGTITNAFAVSPGETWDTVLDGTALQGITLKFA